MYFMYDTISNSTYIGQNPNSIDMSFKIKPCLTIQHIHTYYNLKPGNIITFHELVMQGVI